MLTLSSTDAALARIGRAKEISVEAYTLPRRLVEALETAASGGARVRVELANGAYGDRRNRLHDLNAGLVAQLRGRGVDATLAPAIHAKEIWADGTLYLDEKNWRAGDIVLRGDDAADARTIAATKSAALAREAQLLCGAAAGDDAIVESESFGAGNAVYAALKALGAAGAAPRLLVNDRVLSANRRERAILSDLVRDGVRVRVCNDSAKLAATGAGAWLGSANATVTFPHDDMTDWGICTRNAAIVRAVRSRLEAQWATAKRFRPRPA